MVLTIQMLRGIAALIVVMFHIRGTLNGVYAQSNLGDLLFLSGPAGVDLFFVISGFIICLSSKKNEENKVGKFAIRRLFRVYPLFFVSLIAYQLFVFPEFHIDAFVRSAFLLPRDYSGSAPYFGYNLLFPAWTLLFEVTFYALFTVALAASHKHRVKICSAIIISIYLYSTILQTGGINLSGIIPVTQTDRSVMTVIGYTLGSPMMLLFVCGMWIYSIYDAIRNSNIAINKNLCLYVFFVCSSLYTVLFLSGYKSGIGLSGYGFWAIILITGCLAYELTSPTINKTLLFLGEISYSLYLTHVIAIGIFDNNSSVLTIYPESLGVPRFLLLLSVSIAFAIPVYYFVEKPSIAIGKKIVSLLYGKHRDTTYTSSTINP
ncbi:acyltransferase [Enterobacter sp. Cy-643]|uniref:acyltransferase family protein n=1 Tax=Enterobacter sp. Cy-643 TaxID=2608346 RepID=UPI00141E4985|nr:acyltransferase [Enterobacter sp. Cy-643]NIF32124.1 acyltransferase [Enterobacter sp. Cy-643]